MLRHLAERISRGVILKRRMPERFGKHPIFVSPDARLGFWRFDLEKSAEQLFSVAEEFVKPGHTVWDIGANVGLFTFASAYLSGPSGYSLAVEGDAWLVGLLRKSCKSASVKRAKVEVLHAVIDSVNHVAKFNIARRGRAANFLDGYGSNQSGGVRETQPVVAVTLDWLLDYFPEPDVLKIDVEGAEERVFGGGSRILSDIRPLILCEVDARNKHQVSSLLQNHNYRFYDMDIEKESRRPLTTAALNTIAIPAETG